MRTRIVVMVLSVVVFAAFLGMAEEAACVKPLHVAVVTGGHGFDKKALLNIFKKNKDITFTHVVLKDNSEIFEDLDGWSYDVIVLYNMTQGISEKRRENFLKLLEDGTGLVALHHAIAAWTDWPEYGTIIGAQYFLEKKEIDGKTYPRSEYTHGLDVDIHIEDATHPITQGMSDFTIHDETYRKWKIAEDNHLLLTTAHPKSDPGICWVREHKNARVCFLQLGHGPQALKNANYHKLVARAIQWTARRIGPVAPACEVK